MPRSLLILILAAFSVLSGIALWQHGYWGIIAPLFETSAGVQVFCDLTIALVLVLSWIRRDAKATGRNPWPWVLLTLCSGSFGPLIYLVTRQTGKANASAPVISR